MIISGLIKSSLVDYPGLISCVLFVPGCNYECFYCHNRSLIDGTHDILALDEIEVFLKKRVGKLDGVVITGGEPTLQKDLVPFLLKIKAFGYKIKLDTNGSCPEIVKDLIESNLCDYFAVDYKAPSERYQEICGTKADATVVLETINLIAKSKIPFEVRTTVIPQLEFEDLVKMSEELPLLPNYVLNRYRPPDRYLPADKERVFQKPYTQPEIDNFLELIQSKAKA